MKLIINKNQIEGNAEQFLRRAGYAYIRDRKTNKDSFVRRLGSGFYPRLHMYTWEQGDKVIFDLHLDQKQASYAGQRMHSGEYGGEVVEEEIKRLRGFIAPAPSPSPIPLSGTREGSKDVLEKIGPGDLAAEKIPEVKKKSWWRRLFA